MASHENQHETAETLFLEQAKAYFRDVQAVGRAAPDGQVVNQMEALILKRGRELIRQSFQLALQEEVEEHEKKQNTARNAKRKKGSEDRKAKKS
jgi:hypothetical protein